MNFIDIKMHATMIKKCNFTIIPSTCFDLSSSSGIPYINQYVQNTKYNKISDIILVHFFSLGILNGVHK